MESNIISDYSFDKWKRFTGSENNSKIIVDENLKFSKVFSNMTGDSVKILLNPVTRSQDLNLGTVIGSVALMPWSSEILIADSDIGSIPEINFSGGPFDFKAMNENNFNGPLWYNLTVTGLQSPVNMTAP